MKDISDAEDLMATARDALLNELLPALPKDRRYAALMIANAMAIAARERLAFLHRCFGTHAIGPLCIAVAFTSREETRQGFIRSNRFCNIVLVQFFSRGFRASDGG